jgi:membrane protease YdiL (CAAX protease family)
MNENTPILIEPKPFKKEINKLSRLVIFYELSMVIAAILAVMYLLYAYSFSALTDNLSMLITNGVVYILGVGFGMIFAFCYYKSTSFEHKLTTVRSRMTFKKLLLVIACLLAMQFVYQIFITLVENLLNNIGYSLTGQLDAITASSTSVSMFLYISIIGPIAEEFIFRGLLLRKLEPYGKMFAIVFTSILFGLVHANFYQGILAAFTGIILGYVALEYSIFYSIALHILNNMLFGELLGRLNAAIYVWVSYGLFAISLLTALIFIVKKSGKIKNYIKQNKPQKHTYSYAFSSAFFILFAAINIALSLLTIGKL